MAPRDFDKAGEPESVWSACRGRLHFVLQSFWNPSKLGEAAENAGFMLQKIQVARRLHAARESRPLKSFLLHSVNETVDTFQQVEEEQKHSLTAEDTMTTLLRCSENTH